MATLLDGSTATIAAAMIAGIITLFGLIISKEQKTSEFRQSWIDSLRSDLATFLTNINAVYDGTKVEYDDFPQKLGALSPLYTRLNNSVFSIMLRINPEEECQNA